MNRPSTWLTTAVISIGALGLVVSAVRAPHQGHGAPAPAAAPAADAAKPRTVTMDELHQAGGVPRGWKFALPSGDAAKGRQLFGELECFKCHAIQGESFPAGGGDAKNVGPELTGMGGMHPANRRCRATPTA
jgi:hypothetical protein